MPAMRELVNRGTARWSRDDPKFYVCIRCGRQVPNKSAKYKPKTRLCIDCRYDPLFRTPRETKTK